MKGDPGQLPGADADDRLPPGVPAYYLLWVQGPDDFSKPLGCPTRASRTVAVGGRTRMRLSLRTVWRQVNVDVDDPGVSCEVVRTAPGEGETRFAGREGT